MFQRFFYDCLDSTMLQAERCLQRYGPTAMAIVARSQSHGIGRQQKTWFDQKDQSLLCTFVWPVSQKELPLCHQLALVAAIAVVQALQSLHMANVQIKWPNDILYEGRKLAGILTTCHEVASQQHAVAIGIGLNITAESYQALLALPTTSPLLRPCALLARDLHNAPFAHITPQSPQQKDLLQSLYQALQNNLWQHCHRWRTFGLQPFLTLYRSLDALYLQTVQWQQPPHPTRTGTAYGLSQRGGLCLRDEDDIYQEILYGEVHFVRSPTLAMLKEVS